MTDEQRRTKITYDGHEYAIPASEGEKVISAMTSASPVAVEITLDDNRTLWMLLGAGTRVTVMEDRRGPRIQNAVVF